MNIDRSQEKEIEFDIQFKPEVVHLAIIKEAKKNNGFYSRNAVLHRIENNPKLDEKLKRQMKHWNQVHINRLVDAGYLRQVGSDQWQLTSLADELKLQKEFKVCYNHIKLMEKNDAGVVKSASLKSPYKGLHTAKAERERKIIDGMLRNLTENGYLKKIAPGEYRLTELADKSIAEFARTPGQKGKSRNETKNVSVKATYFDRFIIEDCLTDGVLDQEKVNGHSRKKSILKRLQTLEQAKFMLDGKPSKNFLLSFERVQQISLVKELTLDTLTPEQLQIIKDMRLFLNLSRSQIKKYIYKGDASFAEIDLDYLCRQKVLQLDADLGIYVFSKQGISLSNELFPDAVKYKTKLHSRKEEVEHDMLVYTAYKEFEKELRRKGGRVVEIQNDRQMRSDYAKKHGHMKYGFPDLRILHLDPKGNTLAQDIEIDCGYDGKTIASKISGIEQNRSQLGKNGVGKGDFNWVCKTAHQAIKVAKIASQDKTRRINQTRTIKVFWFDSAGQLHRI